MLKNWTVKQKRIKRKDKGLRNFRTYLLNNKIAAHSGTTIIDLNNSLEAQNNILNSIEERKAYRKEKGLRGGGIRSDYATSLVLSLPKDIPEPTPEQWLKIAKNAVFEIANVNSLDPQEVWKKSIAVLHQEKDKNSHLHLVIGTVHKNEFIKGITQNRTNFATKNSLNKSVKTILGVDNRDYQPKKSNRTDKPLYIARLEKALEQETKAKKAYNRFKLRLKQFYTSLTAYLEADKVKEAAKAKAKAVITSERLKMKEHLQESIEQVEEQVQEKRGAEFSDLVNEKALAYIEAEIKRKEQQDLEKENQSLKLDNPETETETGGNKKRKRRRRKK